MKDRLAFPMFPTGWSLSSQTVPAEPEAADLALKIVAEATEPPHRRRPTGRSVASIVGPDPRHPTARLFRARGCTMKRLRRDPLRFDAFSLFATYGEKQSVSLRDPASVEGFAAAMRQSAERALASKAFLFGQRTEALFERIVAALGSCQLLKREDVGNIFHSLDTDVQPPDFRVLLNDGKQIVVEVKNFYQGDIGTKEQRESTSYLDGLAAYAAAMSCELRIATYWVRWNRWTLVPLAAFRRGEKWSVLSLGDALLANEMGRLGDVLVGTRWPLRLRVLADSSRPSTIGPDGRGTFTTGARELFCEDRKINSMREQQIALFLAFYGDWQIIDSTAEVDDDKLIAVEHHIGPHEDRGALAEYGFEFVGTLSSMISKQHNSSTGFSEVDAVHADFSPGAVGGLIPNDYKGDALPLWRFTIQGTMERNGNESPAPGDSKA